MKFILNVLAVLQIAEPLVSGYGVEEFLTIVKEIPGAKFLSNLTSSQLGYGIPSCVGEISGTGPEFQSCFNDGYVDCVDYVFFPPHILFPPQCPTDVCTEFHFYTADHPTESRDIQVYPSIDYRDADYKAGRKTFFIIHGFTDNGTLAWIQDLTQAILTKYSDSQVVVPEWGKGAVGPNLSQGLGNARIVARLLELFIYDLLDKQGAKQEEFVLIAHSLGAHIAGYMAKYMKKRRNLQLDNCMMLDVDQLLFEPTPPSTRVAMKDFKYQFAFHTSALPFPLGEGYIERIADADVYVNGGGEQPGCQPFEGGANLTPEPIGNVFLNGAAFLANCNHQRPQQYLTEAIRNETCKFVGHRVDLSVNPVTQSLTFSPVSLISDKCTKESCVILGLESVWEQPKGVFQLKTNSPPDFCVQQEYDEYKKL